MQAWGCRQAALLIGTRDGVVPRGGVKKEACVDGCYYMAHMQPTTIRAALPALRAGSAEGVPCSGSLLFNEAHMQVEGCRKSLM